MNPSFDVIIVGAGIVGAACARECARGKLKVLVVDRGPLGGGTTGAGMGHLVAMDDSEAQFALTSYSCSLWHELADDLPEDVEDDKALERELGFIEPQKHARSNDFADDDIENISDDDIPDLNNTKDGAQ